MLADPNDESPANVDAAVSYSVYCAWLMYVFVTLYNACVGGACEQQLDAQMYISLQCC